MPNSTLQQADALATELRDQPALAARDAVAWVAANQNRTDLYVASLQVQAADVQADPRDGGPGSVKAARRVHGRFLAEQGRIVEAHRKALAAIGGDKHLSSEGKRARAAEESEAFAKALERELPAIAAQAEEILSRRAAALQSALAVAPAAEPPPSREAELLGAVLGELRAAAFMSATAELEPVRFIQAVEEAVAVGAPEAPELVRRAGLRFLDDPLRFEQLTARCRAVTRERAGAGLLRDRDRLRAACEAVWLEAERRALREDRSALAKHPQEVAMVRGRFEERTTGRI